MATMSREGRTVFYEDRGTGGPPLVFVHGIGRHEHFAHQVDHFALSHRVIAPDLAGFGRSPLPPGHRCAISDHAADVAWLCDQLALGAPVIVGHSMGGAVAFEVAASRPELPAAIVLLDPIPIVPLPALRAQRSELVARLGGPDYRDAFRAFIESRMFRRTDSAEVRARITNDMCATSQQVLVPTFASISEWSGEHLADRVRCPVLLITAGDGLPADMARTRELIAGLELGRTVGAGHFAHVLVPDQVNAMIAQFLAVSVHTANASMSGGRGGAPVPH